MNVQLETQPTQTPIKRILAVVGKVTALQPILNADRIETAFVDCGTSGSWEGVVSKATFAVGSLCAVFLPDAKFPQIDQWRFMEPRGWRVRLCRFRGAPSECLVWPYAGDEVVGADLTDVFSITKYEKSVPEGLDIAGPWPQFLPRTDEVNFQQSEYLERMAIDSYYITEKADGSSSTAYVDELGFHVCSRNWEMKEVSAGGLSNFYWRAAEKYGLRNKMTYGEALHYEVVGPKIQGNPMKLSDLEIRAFSLFVKIGNRWEIQPYNKLLAYCSVNSIPMARVLSTDNRGAKTKQELQAMAEIRYSNGSHGEGVVIRAMDSRWSFKVINLLYGN